LIGDFKENRIPAWNRVSGGAERRELPVVGMTYGMVEPGGGSGPGFGNGAVLWFWCVPRRSDSRAV
ncbi:MAG: hypothetical protein ACK43N_04095, partial [Pirellulaceae bacterium]